MATHSSILAWRIPWTEEPARLHTVCGVARVGHDLVTKPPYSSPEQDGTSTVVLVNRHPVILWLNQVPVFSRRQSLKK